jgi:hypothetical protein
MRARGTPTLIAGLVAAAMLPILALAFRLPLWLAAAIAIGVFFGVQALMARGEGGGDDGAEPLDEAQMATADALLAEGRDALERLRTAGRSLRDKPMRAEVERLSLTADRILRDVRADPSKAMSVRRLMTFYLPNAASLAEGWRALEGRALPSSERERQTRETMTALNEAFDRFGDQLVQPQVQTLDLDLKVLNDALKTDLERLP